MKTDCAIQLENVSKMFKLYARPSDMFREIWGGKPRYKPFWALRDISLEVKPGQVVGIVGRNGAGKSTLLKIISGTLDKTSGTVETNGRIASILELGTGFNPDFTGRDNIYLGGLMIGLSHEEIRAKEDWIVEFSELRGFIDQPFKTYSSGMQARLTFSTAVCTDPDILILDEVLAVGDARFAKKSFGKINKFRDAGKTILFVSHDINAINNICDQAILLETGKILDIGQPKAITKKYWEMMFVDQELSPDQTDTAKSPDTSRPIDSDQQETSLSQPIQEKKDYSGLVRAGDRVEAEIIDMGILDSLGQRVNFLESGHKYSIYAKALFHEEVDGVGFGFHITNEKGVVMYGIGVNADSGVIFPPQKKGHVLEARLNITMWLTNGTYLLSVGIGCQKTPVVDFLYDAVVFTIPQLPWIQHASVVNLDPSFGFKEYGSIDEV
jgi:lipopolysaccharide transport system ATP-binding protein